MRLEGMLLAVGLFVAGICRASEPVVTFAGFDRPVVGSELSAFISGGDWHKYSWVWERADQTKSGYVLKSEAACATIKDWDLEHWLRVTVKYDGEVIATKEIWVSKVPVVYLTTDSGEPVTTKNFYVSASLRIQGNHEFDQQYDGVTEVKGRGNSSWVYYPQKPFKLKLDKKTDLFGFGKNKHWVLVPNYYDRTGLRNSMARDLARAMGLTAMDMVLVEVVFNGDYHGSYMLAEHVRLDSERIDIFDREKNAEDVADALYDAIKKKAGLAKGDKTALETQLSENFSWLTTDQVAYNGKSYKLSDYGIEVDHDYSGGFVYVAEQKLDAASRFKTSGGVPITVDTPEFAATDKNLMDAAKTIWQNFEDAYMAENGCNENGDSYLDLADVDSMAAIFLLNEMMMNGDPSNSRYSYIDKGGKLTFGPAWDYDFSVGVWPQGNPSGKGRTYAPYHDVADNYYRHWINDPHFCRVIFDKYWNEARPWLVEFLKEDGDFDSMSKYHTELGSANDERWGMSDMALQPGKYPRSYGDDIKHIRTMLTNHLEYLDGIFADFSTMMKSLERYRRRPYFVENAMTKISTMDRCNPNTDGVFGFSAIDQHTITVRTETTATQIEVQVNGRLVSSAVSTGGWATAVIPAAAFGEEKSLISVLSKNTKGETLSRAYAFAEQGVKNGYKLAFELAGGYHALSAVPAEVSRGSWFSLPAPKKDGRVFAGWTFGGEVDTKYARYSQASGVGATISDPELPIGVGSSCSFYNLAAIGGSVTMKANWNVAKDVVGVDYVLNGGTVGQVSPAVMDPAKWVSVTSPTRKGYKFAGWQLQGEISPSARYSVNANERVQIKDERQLCGGGCAHVSFKAIAETGSIITLIANWEELPSVHSIVYDLAGGVAGLVAPTSADPDTWITVSAPIKEGYAFLGWTVTSSKLGANARYSVEANMRQTVQNGVACGAGFSHCSFKNLTEQGGSVTLTANWALKGKSKAKMAFVPAPCEPELITVDGVIADDNGYFVCISDGVIHERALLFVTDLEGEYELVCDFVSRSNNEWSLIDEFGRMLHIDLAEKILTLFHSI